MLLVSTGNLLSFGTTITRGDVALQPARELATQRQPASVPLMMPRPAALHA